MALHQAAALPTAAPAYQRGVNFLLRTQFDDGSWWVKSRSWPFQPHFDSQFSHGKDQWVSAGGTAWAAMALLLTIERSVLTDSFPAAQQFLASHQFSSRTSSDTSSTGRVQGPGPGDYRGEPAVAQSASPSGEEDASHPVSSQAAVNFTTQIAPILERSCLNCHSGPKPKGGLDLSSRAAVLRGGQSGEPPILPGQPERSPLVRFVQDQVEDLEMPPLPKRAQYPPLRGQEIDALKAWIAQGAHWPAGADLGSKSASHLNQPSAQLK